MNSTSLATPGLAPAREFLLFDRGAAERFAIDAFAVQEVLPFGRVAKIDSSAVWVESRGMRWALSELPGECLPVIGGALHALRLGQGSDARVMLVGGLHGVRSSLDSSVGARKETVADVQSVIRWTDGESATFFDHQWACFDEPAAVIPDEPCSLALLATPSNELFKLCSRALLSAGWGVRDAQNGEDLVSFAKMSGPRLVLIDPSFEDGAGYVLARAVKTAASESWVALVSHPALPLNSAMVRWCAPDWAGVVVSYEALSSLLVVWKAQ